MNAEPETTFTRTARGAVRHAGVLAATLTLGIVMACAGEAPEDQAAAVPESGPPVPLDTTARIIVVTGFDGPESVLYDEEQDVYFVSNFNGPSGDRDENGYLARLEAEGGEIQELRWAVGTEEYPFHAGRGMWLQGDTVWVADVDGVHGFHRETAEQLVFVDMSELEPGFLNDISFGPDGTGYVTDTGKSMVYRFRPGAPEVAAEGEELGVPNGILYDPERGGFWLAPWDGTGDLRLWNPEDGSVRVVASSPPGSRLDGLVIWDGALLAASQGDSAIHAVRGDLGGAIIPTRGRPADLGLDTRRGRLAIPTVALNDVEIWQLPRTWELPVN